MWYLGSVAQKQLPAQDSGHLFCLCCTTGQTASAHFTMGQRVGSEINIAMMCWSLSVVQYHDIHQMIFFCHSRWYAITMSSVNICLGATKQKAFRHIFWELCIYYRDPNNNAHFGGQSPPLFLLGWIVVYELGREYLKQQILGVLKVPKHTKKAKSPIPPYYAHIHWNNWSFSEIKWLGNGPKIITIVYQSTRSNLSAGQ